MKKYLKRRKELKDIYKKELMKHKKPMKEKQLADEVIRVKAKAKRKAQQKYSRSTKQKASSAVSGVKRRSKQLAKNYKQSSKRKSIVNWADNVLKGFD